jgi:hypothetical protein
MINRLKPSLFKEKNIFISIIFIEKRCFFFVTKEEIKYLDRIKLIHEQNKGSYIRSMSHLKEDLQKTSEDSYGNIVPNTSSARFLLHLIVADVLGNKYPKEEIINDRIMCWPKGSKVGRTVVGGNGRGEQPNQFNDLRGLSFDRQGNLYVVDKDNNRVQKFDINSD